MDKSCRRAARHLVCVSDNRKAHYRLLGVLDILDPVFVFVGRINRKCDGLEMTLVELGLEFCGQAEFRGAYRREIGGVRKQNDP